LSKARVLIVEDELLTAESLKVLLKRINYEPIGIVVSGEEVLLRVSELNPDIILMDIVLDGKIDGIEASKLLKEKYEIPVIFLTAYGDIKTLSKAKLTEPYGYILKPITNENDLLTTLEIALYNFEIKKKLKKRDEKLKKLEDVFQSEFDLVEKQINKNQTKEERFKIDFDNNNLGNWFNALSNYDRLLILNYLIDGSKIFEDFSLLLKKAKSTVFRHLSILEENSLIIGYREGKSTVYSLPEGSKIRDLIVSGDLSKLTSVFKALGNKERLSILNLLQNEPCATSEIGIRLNKPQSTISRHLKTLQQNGLLLFRKKGRQTIVSLLRERIDKIVNAFYRNA
jgi:DNA-binding transcriptional ArsR family regulator/AmiR/NasT family two-component response regulator